MKLLKLTIAAMLLFSCEKDIENQVVTREGIKEVYSQLDSGRLSDLYYIAVGRESFIANTRLESSDIKENERFEQVANQLFGYYEREGITYKQLLNEVDSMKKYGKDGCVCPIANKTTPIVDKLFTPIQY